MTALLISGAIVAINWKPSPRKLLLVAVTFSAITLLIALVSVVGTNIVACGYDRHGITVNLDPLQEYDGNAKINSRNSGGPVVITT